MTLLAATAALVLGAADAPVAAVLPARQRPAEAAAQGPGPQERWLVPTLHSAVLMGGMRLSLSALWPASYSPIPDESTPRHLRAAYSQPPEYDRHRTLVESDGDPWTLNLVGHGLFGSEVYQRFRQCGHGALAAFGATVVASTAWEYGIEAFHQRPSAVDLIWTPLAGAAFGEARFQFYRLARGASGSTPGALGRAVMILVDPFGELERVAGAGC